MEFLRDLAKFVEDEKQAVLNYQVLAADAPDEISKRVILRISREEERHADFLAWILNGYLEKNEVSSTNMENKKGKHNRPISRVQKIGKRL